MSESEFTKLFNHMNRRFDEVGRRLDVHDMKFKDVMGAIAELGAQIKEYHQEMVVLTRHVDKMREAIK
jgi:uncharacterized coiled-coil DUF342 family protein